MRKLMVLAMLAMVSTGCADRKKLETAVAEGQRLSAEKDSLLNEVLANAEMVSSINSELAKVRDLGANPVTAGEGATTANDQRTVVLGKIRDAITRLQQSEDNLEAAKQRLASMGKRDARLAAQIDRYQTTINEMQATIEKQQAEYLAIIDSQKTHIVALQTDLDTVTSQKVRVEGEKQALIDTMNTVYYVVGTQAELIEKGVAVKEGSKFLVFGGTTLLPARDVNPSAFQVLHRLNDTVLTLPSADKSYRIISRQNPTYLATPTTNGSKFTGGELRIAQPEQFWAASRYLIVVQN